MPGRTDLRFPSMPKSTDERVTGAVWHSAAVMERLMDQRLLRRGRPEMGMCRVVGAGPKVGGKPGKPELKKTHPGG